MDLAYLDAAPDSTLRWAPTAGVRDFANQMAHTTHNFFAPWDDATLLTERQILGQPAPRWRVMRYWLDHAMWTRASVIPHLRLNGVDPPQVAFW